MSVLVGRVGMVMKGAYNSANAYKNLDAVTYNNGTYVAKQDVPAGTVPTNTTYWEPALTSEIIGSSTISNVKPTITAAIGNTSLSGIGDGSLSGAIMAINNDINKSSKVLCIGDSYGVLTDAPWTSKLKSLMGLDNDHFVNACVNGAGFVGNNSSHTFLAQAQGVSNPETFTHVLVMGGFNDANSNASGTYVFTETAFVSTMNYIKNNFVNAKIYVGFMGYCSNKGASITLQDTFITNCRRCATAYEAMCTKYGYNFISKLRYVLSINELYSTEDYYGEIFHPNTDGNARLANVIFNALKGIDIDISYNVSSNIAINTSLFDVSGGISLTAYSRVDNGISCVVHDGASRFISGSTTGTSITSSALNGSDGIKIGSLAGGAIFENGKTNISTFFAYRLNNTIYRNKCGMIIMRGKDVYLRGLVDEFEGYADNIAVEIPNIIELY